MNGAGEAEEKKRGEGGEKGFFGREGAIRRVRVRIGHEAEKEA